MKMVLTIDVANLEKLIREAQRGDVDSFTVLFEQYHSSLRSFLFFKFRRNLDYDILEDVIQKTFLKAYENLWQLEYPKQFSGWLHKIAFNEFLTYNSKKNSQKTDTMPRDTLEELENSISTGFRNWRRDVNPTPEELYEAKELEGYIFKFIKELPPIYQEAVIRKIMGYSPAEEAQRLGTSEVNVRIRRHRAYTILKKNLFDLYPQIAYYHF